MRIPDLRVGEESRIAGADTGSGKQGMCSRDDPLGARNGHGLLDRAQNGVDRSVETKSFLDNILVQGQLRQILIAQRWQICSESVDLLLVELFNDVGVLSKTEHDPRAS